MNMRARKRALHRLYIYRSDTDYAFLRMWGCTCPRAGKSRDDCPKYGRRWRRVQ